MRERESALQGWEGVELETVEEWCVSGEKDLRFIGREFHKRGKELRNDRSANWWKKQTKNGGAWWKQVEGKDTDDLRSGFCWEV